MKTLDEIMLSVRTDKASKYHNYTPVYQNYFEPFRYDKFVFLELGLGDKTSLNREGEDLLAFQEYFPNAWIVGIDNDVNKLYSDKRIRTYCCDQTDEVKLKEIIKNEGSPFIIIDDCSHLKELTIKSFEILFPLLKSGGLYCIEDVVAPAYWPDWGGCETIFDSGFMNYFFQLCHFVNLKRQETFNPPCNLKIPNWIKEIDSIHFHHSQIIIRKK
jgi:hypothetical protein